MVEMVLIDETCLREFLLSRRYLIHEPIEIGLGPSRGHNHVIFKEEIVAWLNRKRGYIYSNQTPVVVRVGEVSLEIDDQFVVTSAIRRASA